MTSVPSVGVYPVDSVKDVADSLSIDSLGVGAAEALAGDVEYRIHLILQEAKKFMVNGRRRTLLPEDVTYAMDALNVEPILQPPRPLAQPSFQALSVPTASGSDSQQIYYLQDDEIDLVTYLKTPPVPGKSLKKTAGVKWKAHWLAVEGVQPAIPENPIIKEEAPIPSASIQKPKGNLPVPTTGSAALSTLAKSILSQELQLYFTRLTTALIPPETPTSQTDRHRMAALASLRSDPGLGALIVYLVKWLSESVAKCLGGATTTLIALLEVMEGLIENEAVFMEPYLHQLLPSLMSILMTVPLGPHPAPAQQTPSTFEVRQRAAGILGKLCSSYGRNHEELIPRITSTLIRALQSPPYPSPLGPSAAPVGRYEGAVLGLGALGQHAVRRGIWGSHGDTIRTLGSLIVTLGGSTDGGKGKGIKNLTKVTVAALQQLVPPVDKSQTVPTPRTAELEQAFGAALAHSLEKRAALGEALLRLKEQEAVGQSDDAGREAEVMEVD